MDIRVYVSVHTKTTTIQDIHAGTVDTYTLSPEIIIKRSTTQIQLVTLRQRTIPAEFQSGF